MRPRILLVDDHLILREGLRSLLQRAEFDVVGEAGTLAEAVHALRTLAPQLVLLDMSLGADSGLEVLAEIRRRQLNVAAVVLSMHSQPRQVIDAVRMGAAGYVLKGSSGAELTLALNRALLGLHHWSAAIAEDAQEALSGGRAAGGFDKLTEREMQVLRRVVRGLSSAAIAGELNLSPKTVESYRCRLLQKLDVKDTPTLVRMAIKEGVLNLDGE